MAENTTSTEIAHIVHKGVKGGYALGINQYFLVIITRVPNYCGFLYPLLLPFVTEAQPVNILL